MKTSIFNKLVCSSLMLVFVASCGKEQKSGAAPAPAPVAPVVNTVVTPVNNLTAEGQAVLSELQAWYNAADTVNMGNMGTFTRKERAFQQQSSSTFKFSASFCFFGLGNCNKNTPPAPTHCYYLNGADYAVGTFNAGNCDNPVIQTKSSNALLAEAVTGGGLTLLAIQKVGPGIYFLVYGANAFRAQKTYTINTNAHSIFNPVVVQDIDNAKVIETY